MQVHERLGSVATFRPRLPGIDERLAERAAVGDVVGAAGPLERLAAVSRSRRRPFRGRRATLDAPVAAAPVEAARAAGPRDGVGDTGCRDGVHERRLTRRCVNAKQINRVVLFICRNTIYVFSLFDFNHQDIAMINMPSINKQR